MRHQIKLSVTITILSVAIFSAITLQAEPLSDVKPTATSTSRADNDSAKTAQAEKAEATLIGKWENPYFVLESDSNSRSLRYHFRKDGTYTVTMGGAETQIEENGTWEISEDGNKLLMRSRSTCDGKVVTTSATIKHLSMDELVLEQPMCVAGVLITAEPQEFYFNKF